MRLKRDTAHYIQILQHILKDMHTLDFSYAYEYAEGFCLSDTLNEVKIHYTYGHIDTLKEKAKVLAKDDNILVITIDKIEEIIKDTRTEKLIEYAKGE